MESVVRTVMKIEERTDDPEVSIVFTDDTYIRELNYQYRHKDSSTDVLSFAMEESNDDEPDVGWDEENILGDIIISVETAERQAKEYGHSFEREMAYLTTHGMLHLLGYDHENEEERSLMREKEEQVLSILEIGR
ncbi:MAG TPA: rRNA maturation RNase YbeY [Desulfobacteria bacterium]|nr:rRNA maturation RNase YbeY [Desulfobacteria bacterium]